MVCCLVLVWGVQVGLTALSWCEEGLCRCGLTALSGGGRPCAQPCPGLRGFCWCGWRGLCVGAFAVLGEEIIMEKWGGRRGNNYGKVPAYERMKSEWFICIFMYFYILCVFVCIFVYLFFLTNQISVICGAYYISIASANLVLIDYEKSVTGVFGRLAYFYLFRFIALP